MRLVFITILLSLHVFSFAQETDTDTISLPPKILTPSFYLDYGKLVSLALENETKYEGGIELLYKERIPFVLEFGMASLSPKQAYSNATYESSGTYLRFGTGYYRQFTPKNKIGFRVQYGLSTFDELATITSDSSNNSSSFLEENIDRPNLAASWLEFVLYTDTQLNKLLSVGMHARFRYLLDHDILAPYYVYSIPGYGRSFDDSIPAFNLFIKASF